MNGNLKKLLIIGPSIERTKGGMATVIQSQLDSMPANYGFQFEHIVTHVDGGKWDKLVHFLRGFFYFIRQKDIRLVHIHVASNASFYRKSLFVYTSRLKKIPVIMHIHGHEFDEFYNRSNVLSKFFIRKTFKKCSRVLVLSRYWYDFFCKNIVNGNVVILHNGVNPSSFSDCITTTDTLNRFLFLGRLGQRKGVYDLLDAINILVHTKNYKDLKCYLAGDGDLKEVEAVINKNQLEKNVFLMGWLDDARKHECLKKVYTVVLPSYSEGLPMALLEAMACGKIIISTRVGGIPELIDENKNGFLINAGDVNALAEKMMYVINNKEEMQHIFLNNINKVQQQYDLRKINTTLYALYAEIISAS